MWARYVGWTPHGEVYDLDPCTPEGVFHVLVDHDGVDHRLWKSTRGGVRLGPPLAEAATVATCLEAIGYQVPPDSEDPEDSENWL